MIFGVVRVVNFAHGEMMTGAMYGAILLSQAFKLDPLVAIAPIGLVMRMFGKDFLRLKLDRNAKSYWIDRAPPGPPPQSMKNQF